MLTRNPAILLPSSIDDPVRLNLPRRQLIAIGGLAMLSSLLPRAAGAASPAEPGATWQFKAPLPQKMGEIVGAGFGNDFYVFGGLDDEDGSFPIGAVFRYDTIRNSWATLPKMPAPAHHLMCATLGDSIYIFGGFDTPVGGKWVWRPTGASWRYQPATGKWTRLAPLPRPRGAGYAVTVGGRIYVIGGVTSPIIDGVSTPIPLGKPAPQTVVGWVDEYDPSTDSWRPRADMPTPRNHYFAGEVGGRIYAIDGRNGSVFVNYATPTDIVESYDPKTDHWEEVARAPMSRGDVNGVSHKGELYVTGGEFESPEGKTSYWKVDVFNPSTGAWRTLPHTLNTRHGFASALVGDQWHIVGGSFQSDGEPGVDSDLASHEVIALA